MLRNLSSIEKIFLSILVPAILIVIFVAFQNSEAPVATLVDPKFLPLTLAMIALAVLAVFGLAIYQLTGKLRKRYRRRRARQRFLYQ